MSLFLTLLDVCLVSRSSLVYYWHPIISPFWVDLSHEVIFPLLDGYSHALNNIFLGLKGHILL